MGGTAEEGGAEKPGCRSQHEEHRGQLDQTKDEPDHGRSDVVIMGIGERDIKSGPMVLSRE
jgi:hypothetical protein